MLRERAGRSRMGKATRDLLLSASRATHRELVPLQLLLLHLWITPFGLQPSTPSAPSCHRSQVRLSQPPWQSVLASHF